MSRYKWLSIPKPKKKKLGFHPFFQTPTNTFTQIGICISNYLSSSPSTRFQHASSILDLPQSSSHHHLLPSSAFTATTDTTFTSSHSANDKHDHYYYSHEFPPPSLEQQAATPYVQSSWRMVSTASSNQDIQTWPTEQKRHYPKLSHTN